MKKPILFLFIAAMLCSFSACEEPHTHSFSEEWSFDETYHWHKADCLHSEEIADKECHSFENGKCKVCDFPEPKPPEPARIRRHAETVFYADGSCAVEDFGREKNYYEARDTVGYLVDLELLIGDYKVQKPDVTGFHMLYHKPKWAAGYPTEEIFGREYLLASDDQVKKVRELFKGVASKLNLNKSPEILAEGDIRFLYECVSSKNDITFDTDEIGMKVYEKSEGLLRSDKEGEITIEHYVDPGICYEILNGNTTAYSGDYTDNFYAMLPYTIMQLCEFMNQYLNSVNEGVPDAYEVYVCECEYDAVRLIVKDCAEISYIFDEEGKILAAKIWMNNNTAEIFTGKINVTIPVLRVTTKP